MRPPPSSHALLRLAPGLRSLGALRGTDWLREIVIGAGVAAVGVPGGLSMAQLIGLPAEAGLYACIAPALLYALVGPSARFLMIGPDTATSMLLAATMTSLGASTLAARADTAASLTLMVGLLCLAASLARLGVISNLISKAVLVGYLAGVALSLFVKQLSPISGVELQSAGLIRPFIELARKHSEIHWPTLAIGVLLLAILRLCKLFVPRIPGAIVVLVVAITASALLHFDARGIPVIGTIPAGLPWPRLPSFGHDANALLQAAVGVMVVSSSSGLITARAFGQQIGARTHPNREIAGFGIANVGAALFQGFAVTASDSRTAVALGSGGHSAMVGIAAAGTVAFVALFLTAPIALLPHAALAAILASAAIDLIDIRAFLNLARISRHELVLALIATAGVLWLGVLSGVIIAVAATLANLIAMVARPRDGVMGRAAGSGDLVTLRRDPRARQSDRILVYLFEASIFFVNADYFVDRLRLALRSRPHVGWVVLDTSSMTYLDSSGIEAMVQIEKQLEKKGVMLLIGGGHGRFRDVLFRSGFADIIGEERIFTTPEGALATAEVLRDAAAMQPAVRIPA